MSALKKLRRWLQQRTRLSEPGPDDSDLQLPHKQFAHPDFNQGEFHNDVERQLKSANRETHLQRNQRSRAGPWQQK
jgi:hypothetical protein